MTRRIIEVRTPARFVAGTIGMPGQRSFYLQAREGSSLVSVLLEKGQVLALAERLDHLLDEVSATRESGASIPASSLVDNEDTAPLDLPLEEEFRVGAMALGWDDAHRLVVIEAHAVTDEEYEIPELADDAAEGPTTLRMWLTAEQARAFSHRARSLVAAGRPDCPFCNQPIDPEGHICPRANGFRRRT